MKSYNETYKTLRYKSTDKEGKEKVDTSILNEGRAEKALERAQKAGEEVEVAHMKSFVFYKAESVADFQELVPSEQEVVDIFNRGYVLKQNTIVQEYMDTDDWEGHNDEGAFDLRQDASIVRERTKATPEEKATRDLLKLSPEQLARVLASFKSAGQEQEVSA
jgi:ribosomal protein L11 methylase PrmA